MCVEKNVAIKDILKNYNSNYTLNIKFKILDLKDFLKIKNFTAISYSALFLGLGFITRKIFLMPNLLNYAVRYYVVRHSDGFKKEGKVLHMPIKKRGYVSNIIKKLQYI